MSRPPRLRTVLLLVDLLILLLPVAGIAILRLYHDALVRRTESELIVQGAFVREAFRQEYARLARPATIVPAPAAARLAEDPAPLVPQLELSATEVLPPAADALPAAREPDPVARAAGLLFTPVLQQAGRVTLAGIRVTDRHGIVVASTRGELGLSLAHREEAARALSGEYASRLRRRVSDQPKPPLTSISRGQRYRVFVAIPILEAGLEDGVDGDRDVIGAVLLSRTPLDVAKALYLNRRALAIGSSALLVVVVIVALLTSLTISRPIRALIRQSEAVCRGERGAVAPLAWPGTREMAQLSTALAGMARTLEERAEYIRSFASHVSHEFKTPLTTIRGSVELLREHFDEMSEQQRTRFFDSLDAASQRLEQLVHRLRQQAHADAMQPGDECCELARVLEKTITEYRQRGLDISFDGEIPDEQVGLSADVLSEILSGLVENALLHGGEDVRVTISVSPPPASHPSDRVITISDTGPGISDANADKVFTPFFTTAREEGGSGLGLSIVRSLVEAHGGSIELIRTSPGAVFAIRIPRARG
ncbi:MAG: histidine kinase [Acidobacteriota bacterium]|nr:MAG: histidine kinase [Acidobacteriota bacterium]